MRQIIRFLLLASTILASPYPFADDIPVTTLPAELSAVEIAIGSIGTGIDSKAYRKLRHIIGDAVAKNVIDKFVVYNYGIEGGFSGCVQASPTATIAAFEKFTQRLSTLHPKPGTTYTYTPTTDCINTATAAAKAATKYLCFTYDQGGSDVCRQFKCTSNCGNFPKNWKPSGTQWQGACPNSPPSDCP